MDVKKCDEEFSDMLIIIGIVLGNVELLDVFICCVQEVLFVVFVCLVSWFVLLCLDLVIDCFVEIDDIMFFVEVCVLVECCIVGEIVELVSLVWVFFVLFGQIDGLEVDYVGWCCVLWQWMVSQFIYKMLYLYYMGQDLIVLLCVLCVQKEWVKVQVLVLLDVGCFYVDVCLIDLCFVEDGSVVGQGQVIR